MSRDNDPEVAALRRPPHSQEAEQAVIASILLDNTACDRCGILADADFYGHEHRLIFAAVGKLVQTGEPADVVTVYDRLQAVGGRAAEIELGYINALAQAAPSAANVRRYAEIVRRHAKHRRLIATAGDALALAWEGEDPDAALDRIADAIGALERGRARRMPRSIAHIAAERLDHYTALQAGEIAAGWPTHIPRLDGALMGGFRPGNLYLLGARPSVGKSSFGQYLAMALAAQRLPTLFLSQEMSDAEVADRGIASAGRASYSELLSGTATPETWSRVSEGCEAIKNLDFYVDDQPALTLRDVQVKARSIKGLKVLVLDYMQLCAGTRRDGNRNSEIEEISRGLKALAKDQHIAVLALSQLNRAVEQRQNKRPMLADLRDSGAVEQDADVVMCLWPVRELQDGHRLVGLGIDKNRQGRTVEFGLDFHGDTQRWAESTADIQPKPAAASKERDL